MTKIGEGGVPSVPSEGSYQKELKSQLVRFEHHLDAYQMASNEDERAELQNLMNEQMALIQSSVRELKISGAAKQGETVQGDYNRFAKDPTDQNYTALQQDLSTLKEYSQLPSQ